MSNNARPSARQLKEFNQALQAAAAVKVAPMAELLAKRDAYLASLR